LNWVELNWIELNYYRQCCLSASISPLQSLTPLSQCKHPGYQKEQNARPHSFRTRMSREYLQSLLLSKILSHCGRVSTLHPWGGTFNIRVVIEKWRRCGIFCSQQNKTSRAYFDERVYELHNVWVGRLSSSQKLMINEHTCTSRRVLLLLDSIVREEKFLVINCWLTTVDAGLETFPAEDTAEPRIDSLSSGR